MVRVERLGKRFGAHWVFRGLSFQVKSGDCLVVLGSNGSGKSTLLKVLASLASASEGRVETSSGLKLGYASLDMSLYSHLTAHEHVDLLGKLRACPVDADKVLGSVGLSVSRDKLVGQFSTGMRARLKLALATVHQPDLLMLDEPTAALDEAGQDIVESVVRGQLSRGAVVLATNDKKDRRHATHELELAG